MFYIFFKRASDIAQFIVLTRPSTCRILVTGLLSIAITIDMSSTYTGHAPSSPAQLDPRIIPFFEKFYATSDSPEESAHNDYVDALTPDGTLVMGTKKCSGKDEIMTLRKGLWSGPVKTR